MHRNARRRRRETQICQIKLNFTNKHRNWPMKPQRAALFLSLTQTSENIRWRYQFNNFVKVSDKQNTHFPPSVLVSLFVGPNVCTWPFFSSFLHLSIHLPVSRGQTISHTLTAVLQATELATWSLVCVTDREQDKDLTRGSGKTRSMFHVGGDNRLVRLILLRLLIADSSP